MLLKEGCVPAAALPEMSPRLAQFYELYPLNDVKIQDVQGTHESRIHNAGSLREYCQYFQILNVSSPPPLLIS